jgi:hypothetical protein
VADEDKDGEIPTCSKMLEYIAKVDNSDIKWKFQCIVSNEYKLSQCYIILGWDNGDMTNEPLKIIVPDDPVICVVYVHENYLLDKPDWKSFKYKNTLWGDATTLRIAIAMKDPKELIDILETATHESEFVAAN